MQDMLCMFIRTIGTICEHTLTYLRHAMSGGTGQTYNCAPTGNLEKFSTRT